MEQPTIIKNYATYVGGLFTEATPLNYPENTVQFTQNFRYDPSGYIERRLGLEEAGNIQRETANCDLVDTYRWESVANRNDIEFIVIRNGDEVSIYEEVSPTEDEYTHKFTIDLHDHLVESTTDLNLSPISMVSGRGELFITGKHINPFRVEYTPTDSATTCTDAAAPGFKVVPYDVLTRDFEGIDDGVDNQENPTTLSDSHLYNLLNRGWTRTRIYEYFTEVGEYPSKSEYYILGFFTDTDGKEKWSVEELRKTNTGSSNAPTGHIIQNVFNTCIDDDYVSTETIPITRYNVNNDNTVTIITDVPHTASDGDTVELIGGNSILHTWCTYDAASET
ncbi:MAG TPA: hypothetical protein EYP39_04975, partial [Ghiorsea sp.]|nr:hypothetical protein [Ghiorsea sp.]